MLSLSLRKRRVHLQPRRTAPTWHYLGGASWHSPLTKARPAVLLLALFVGCAGSPAPAPSAGTLAKPEARASLDASSLEPSDAGKTDRTATPWPYRTPVVVRGSKGMVVSDNRSPRTWRATSSPRVATPPTRRSRSPSRSPSRIRRRATSAAAASRSTRIRRRGRARSTSARPRPPRRRATCTSTPTASRSRRRARASSRPACPGSVAGPLGAPSEARLEEEDVGGAARPRDQARRRRLRRRRRASSSTLERRRGKRLKKHPVSAALFFPDGAPPPKGSTFKNPELADGAQAHRERARRASTKARRRARSSPQMKAEGGLITARRPQELQGQVAQADRVHVPRPQDHVDAAAVVGRRHARDDLRTSSRATSSASSGFQSPEALHYVFEAMRRALRRAQREARRSRLREDADRRAPLRRVGEGAARDDQPGPRHAVVRDRRRARRARAARTRRTSPSSTPPATPSR